MKNFKHYMLGALTMSAALAFTACSSDNEGIKPADEVGGFYLRLSLVGEQTRTELETPQEDASVEESKVTTGTLYLYEGSNLRFQKKITESDWETATPGQGNTGTTNAIAVSVNNVKENTEYSVYFLANDTHDSPLGGTFVANAAFAGKYAEDNAFVMFNQNDPKHEASQYKVEFTAENKSANNPAKIKNGQAIQIERVVARIDAPEVGEVKTIATPSEGTPSESQKDAQTKVEKLELVKYAISNLPKKTNIMQQWNSGAFVMPNLASTDYFNAYDEFGDNLENKGNDLFVTTTDAPKNYVFENKALANGNEYTAMYMQFKVTLKTDADTEKDFEDGTFYRYDNKIYTSLESIKKSIGGTNPFGDGVTVETLLGNGEGKLNRNEAKECAASEADLAKFRKDYHIEVFHKGLCYYNVPVENQNQKFTDNYTTLRNTIYRIKVNSIYNIGTDVPNGKPDDVKPNYYIQVSVSVNPWVLKAYNVDLK